MNVLTPASGQITSDVVNNSQPAQIRVLIADDHPLYREGLAYAINRHTGMIVIGEADNGKRLVEMVRQHQPDVVLSDVKMPYLSGIEAVREIVSVSPDIQCILVSQYNRDQFIAEAIGVGASGYLVKKASRHEITDAILSVSAGRQFFCRFASEKLKKIMAGSIYNMVPGPSRPAFAEREKAIISLICEEKSSDAIGKELFMSARTVEGLKAAIMDKIGVRTSIGIALYAVQHGLVKLDGYAGGED